ASIGEPVARVLAREPASPAYVQHLPEIGPKDRNKYVNARKHAEAQHQAQELVELLVLQGVVEKIVPLVDLDVEIDEPEHHSDDEGEQPSRLPALLRAPIGYGELPHVAEELAVGLFHEGWLPAGGQIRPHMGGRAALRNRRRRSITAS